jgi:urease accessory protein
VESEALLVFAPDPVQAFADSSYTQRQEFRLAPDSGLVLLDWYSSGRAARGERWAFGRFESRNDVFIGRERVFVDSLRLNAADGVLGHPHRTGRFNCCALLLFGGAMVGRAAGRLLEGIAARPVECRGTLICSASPIREGAVLRVAGESVEEVAREIQTHLNPLAELLGDNPWLRKW